MSAIYDYLANRLLNGAFDWSTATLQLIAWAGTPTFVAADDTIATFKTHGATERGRSQPVLARSISVEGIAKSGPIVIPSVAVGSQVTHFTLTLQAPVLPDNGNMLTFIDDVLGLPYDADGTDLIVQPDWLQNRGWFRP